MARGQEKGSSEGRQSGRRGEDSEPTAMYLGTKDDAVATARPFMIHRPRPPRTFAAGRAIRVGRLELTLVKGRKIARKIFFCCVKTEVIITTLPRGCNFKKALSRATHGM
jgi:hypothetical protein